MSKILERLLIETGTKNADDLVSFLCVLLDYIERGLLGCDIQNSIHILQNENKLSQPLQRLLRISGRNIDWILTGKESFKKNSVSIKAIEDYLNNLDYENKMVLLLDVLYFDLQRNFLH